LPDQKKLLKKPFQNERVCFSKWKGLKIYSYINFDLMIILLAGIFIAGYLLISFETYIRINKAAIALFTGILCWIIFIVSSNNNQAAESDLVNGIPDIAGIIFFLISAMTIVELIDAHDGFELITKRIDQTSKRKLVWTITLITFFLSPILDNLTTSIVMVLLLRKLVGNPKQRMVFIGMIIIAANAGGVWSPMGDVTTTMLWIGGQITAATILLKLFLPSIFCVVVPLIICTFKMHGNVRPPESNAEITQRQFNEKEQYIVLFSGLLILLSVPVLKMLTGLPPYMSILFGLGVLWIITEIIHHKKSGERSELTVAEALRRIDTPSILFFLGLLLGVAALESAGALHTISAWLDVKISNENIIVILIGLLSSIVDNVPLVAAAQSMYSLERYTTDHNFWLLLSYCAGTGGSVLLIGSAAGVAAMGMEQLSFIWYLKKISLLALIGFFSGIVIYFLQQLIMK
jgi:Na+/H+ antiporter NhaD/arsenite permease-like protein